MIAGCCTIATVVRCLTRPVHKCSSTIQFLLLIRRWDFVISSCSIVKGFVGIAKIVRSFRLLMSLHRIIIGCWLHTACHLVFLSLWIALPCISVAWWHLILLHRTNNVYTWSDWDQGAIVHLYLVTALVLLRFEGLVWLLRIHIVRSRLGWLLSIERWEMTCAVMLHDVLTWAEFAIVIGLLRR